VPVFRSRSFLGRLFFNVVRFGTGKSFHIALSNVSASLLPRAPGGGAGLTAPMLEMITPDRKD
jgi:hypothetical protein